MQLSEVFCCFSSYKSQEKWPLINVTERNTLPVLYKINSSTAISLQDQDYTYIAIYSFCTDEDLRGRNVVPLQLLHLLLCECSLSLLII